MLRLIGNAGYRGCSNLTLSADGNVRSGLGIIKLIMAESYGRAEAVDGVLPRVRACAGGKASQIVRNAAGITAA
jgi:hypothetical protein